MSEINKQNSEEYCLFCEPPVLHEQCKGHFIDKTKGNRFMEDNTFLWGARIEMGEEDE